jgi:hypothetical protein
MDQEHNHLGEPTYAAYAHGCRHFDCLTAFEEYKLRLAQRKLNGAFVDLRKRQNGLLAEAQAFDEQHRPVIVGELPPGAPDEADAQDPAGEAVAAVEPQTGRSEGSEKREPTRTATETLRAADDRVLKFLEVCVLPGGNGKLNANLLRVMPTVLQMSPDHCQAALDELENEGLLAGDGTDIYLVPAEVG